MADPTTAQRLAETLHAGQVDKAGKPYIEHLRRVAQNVAELFPDHTQAEIEAAWLHDVLEDTDATWATLMEAGISTEAIKIIQELTRMPGDPYLPWINRLSKYGSLSAVRVKYADNLDNSDMSRMPGDEAAARRLRTRYLPAREMLAGRLGIRDA